MKELWNKTFELARRHIVLWVPCSLAGILMLWLGKLERAEIRWFVRVFATQHSVLGGEVLSADPAQTQRQAMMVMYPSAFLKYLVEVCLFVVALTVTKNLVCMILNQQRPDLTGALQGILPRSREVLLLSLKYIAVMAVLGGVLIVIGSSPLTSDRIHQIALSKAFVYVFTLAGEACIAWLLLPPVMRLLRPPGAPIITNADRKLGTAFAVAASASALLLEYLIGRAESTVTFDRPWEGEASAVMNTVVVNTPQVLLFIALGLLALQASGEVSTLDEEAEIA